MGEYVKIRCCGDCAMYNWNKHKPCCGAHVEFSAQEHFYRDCPKGICNDEETAEQKWISVKERLPEDERLVLGLMLGKFRFVGSCRPSDKTWFCATQSASHPCKKEVTHWMPLPEPPKVAAAE